MLELTNSNLNSHTNNLKALQTSMHRFGTLEHKLAKRNDADGTMSIFNEIPKLIKPNRLNYHMNISLMKKWPNDKSFIEYV